MKILTRGGIVYLGIVVVIFSKPQSQFTEQEKYGFQAIYASRTFDTVQTVMSQGLLNYRYTTGMGTQVIVSIGASNFFIPSSVTGVGEFQSAFTTTYRIGLKQYLGGFYISSDLWYYSAEGDVKIKRPDSVSYSFQNTYSFYEGPFQIGYNLVLDRLALTIGATTSFVYGKNQKKLTVFDHTFPMDFGKINTDFISRLPLGFVAGISIPLSSEYSLQVSSNWYSTKGFTASLALWAVAK